MIIQHNLSAMNAQRMYGITEFNIAKNTEKLSSGYKINRAADDAAGLAISEKMRRQVRGLTQAVINCQDGISMVQIADGAMAEIHDMLHRCTELAVKSANGTLTDSDRNYIQREITALLSEIDSISVKTTFNEMPVLRGEGAELISPGGAVVKGGLPSWVTLGVADTTKGITDKVSLPAYDPDTTHQYPSSILDFSGFDGSAEKLALLTAENTGFYTTCCTCTNHYSIKFTNGNTSRCIPSGKNHYVYEVGIGGATNGEEIVGRIIAATGGRPQGHYTRMLDNGDGTMTVFDYRTDKSANPSSGRGSLGRGVAYDLGDPSVSPTTVDIQAGTENDPNVIIQIKLPAISTSKLGISSSDVSTQGGATNAIGEFKGALEYVSSERSRMGAYQNRLEHTIRNLNNVVENTASAESQIRDTDMAKEMVAYSNNNILAQAGTAVMAQANQSSQNVLAILTR